MGVQKPHPRPPLRDGGAYATGWLLLAACSLGEQLAPLVLIFAVILSAAAGSVTAR